jgi:hypothetical protein
MIRLLASLLATAVAVQLGATPSYARDVLTPITTCDEDEGSNQCLVAGLVWSEPASKAQIQRQVRGRSVIKRFLVTGELDGGPAKPYALTFSQPLSDYFSPTDHSGPIAYEPGADDLTVRTNRGRLRVLSKVQVEEPPNIVVIDERSWEVVARYYRPWIDLSFLRRRAPFWDEGRNTCISMPSRGGAVTFAGICTKPKRVATYSSHSIPKGFERAGSTTEKIEAAVRDLRTLQLQAADAAGSHHGGQGWGVYVYRVKSTHLLVLYGYCTDCY